MVEEVKSMTRFRPAACTAYLQRCKKLDGLNINKLFIDDLLMEILCRLPCKFAFQCKSVCKLWHSIISNPCFARHFISHHAQGNLYDEEEEVSFRRYYFKFVMLPQQLAGNHLPLDFLPCFQGEQGRYGKGCILSSCNDLLLCSTIATDEAMYYVCNPFTKQWAAIPPAPLPQYRINGCQPISFVCDPYYHIDNQGVLVNPHCSFRIARAFANSRPEDTVFDVDIFSSETWEWTNMKIVREQVYTRYPFRFLQQTIVLYNGRMYLQIGRTMVVIDPYNNEGCGEINFPEDKLRSQYAFDGFCCCGSLWLCQLNKKVHILSMWRLEDYNQRVKEQYWSLERQAPLPGEFVGVGEVLGIHPHNPDIVYMRILPSNKDTRGSIVAWNLETGKTRVVFQSDDGFTRLTTRANNFYLDVPIWPSPVPNVPKSH